MNPPSSLAFDDFKFLKKKKKFFIDFVLKKHL